jgi:hypothetical protein
MDSKGYVAIFKEPLGKEAVREFAQLWLEQYSRLEQVCPGQNAGTVTLKVDNVDALLWEKNMQFRVMSGEDFSWIYLNMEGRVIETSGLPYETNTLPLDVLVELEGIEEVVDQQNERRLDELEKIGLL